MSGSSVGNVIQIIKEGLEKGPENCEGRGEENITQKDENTNVVAFPVQIVLQEFGNAVNFVIRFFPQFAYDLLFCFLSGAENPKETYNNWYSKKYRTRMICTDEIVVIF